MTVLVEKGFKPEDFANLHPGGKLGKRLMRVEQLMHARRRRCRSCICDTAMRDVIYEMSRKGLGMTSVVDDGRPARRHHHRRRPAPQDGDDAGHSGADRPRRDDPQPGHHRPRHAGGRGAGPARTAQDHVDRRHRRTTAASKASCTCTTSGARRWSSGAGTMTVDLDSSPATHRRARRAAARAGRSARRGSATSCATAGGSIAAGPAIRITTCSASTSWSPTRSTWRSRS